MTFTIEIPGQPVSAKNSMRPLRLGNGRTILAISKQAKTWYDRVLVPIKQQWPHAPISTPVHVVTHQYLKHDVGSRVSPDGDNVQTAAWDALVKAGVLADDRLIMSWSGTRQRDRANPRIVVEIVVITPTAEERAA